MVNRNLIHNLGFSDEDLDAAVAEAFGDVSTNFCMRPVDLVRQGFPYVVQEASGLRYLITRFSSIVEASNSLKKSFESIDSRGGTPCFPSGQPIGNITALGIFAGSPIS